MQGYDDAIASDNPFDSASIEYAGTAFGHRVVAVRQRWSAALTISRAFWNILSVPINRSLILRIVRPDLIALYAADQNGGRENGAHAPIKPSYMVMARISELAADDAGLRSSVQSWHTRVLFS